MGTSAQNMNVRTPPEIRNPIRELAERFSLSESDMTRIVLAKGLKVIGKNCKILQLEPLQKKAS